jgi:hypothetical protein
MAQPRPRAFAAQLFLAPAGTTCRRHSLPHPAGWPYPRPDSSLLGSPPIPGLAADPDLPTCLHRACPDARSCQYSASRSTTRLRLLRAITTPFVTEDAATTIRILARTHVPSRGQTPDGCDGQVDLCDGLMSWSGGCLRRRCREGFRWVVVLVGGQAMVQLAEQAAEQIAQPRGVAIAGDTALVVVASGLQ